MKDNTEYSEDISVGEIIGRIKVYFFEVLRLWWVVLIFCTIFCAYFVNKHLNTPTKFAAELKFIVEGDGGSSGMIGGLLGQFGIKRSGKNNPYKILEVARSNRVCKKLLVSELDNEKIGNKIVEYYKLREHWAEDNNQPMVDYRFKDTLALGDPIERLVFKAVKGKIWGSSQNPEEALLSISFDEDKGIYLILSRTVDENLSLKLATQLFEEVKQFFENDILENQRKTLNILKSKVDSLQTLRDNKNYDIAVFEDTHRYSIDKVNSSKKLSMLQDLQAINLAYGEIVKNYEMADISLKDNQSLFMTIDYPISPLTPQPSSLVLALILGLFFGGLTSLIIIIVRKTIIDSTNN